MDAAEIEAQRGAIYGTPIANHERIASAMSDYLGIEILPSDAAMLMVLVKESRLMQTPDHADSLADRDIYLDFVRRFRAIGR